MSLFLKISTILVLCRCATSQPVIYNITASSMYDAGLQHGRLAIFNIKGWLNSKEMSSLVQFSQGVGKEHFERLKKVNSAHYPEFVDQMQGIADGAGISLDAVWTLNLITELEAVQSGSRSAHCSDIYAVSDGAFNHGHNEDWDGIIYKYWYFIKYTAASADANFQSCAGLVYPGSVVGWASTWNSHGMYLAQNSLFPHANSDDGVATIFAQASAICGKAGGTSQDAVVAELTRYSWGSGASVNLIDIRRKTLANVEVHRNRYSLHQVANDTSTPTNYSHFNMYKHLEPGRVDSPEPSSVHRQARADALPSPKTREDIINLLSDATDPAYPIYRNETLATLVLDGSTGRMDVWCCGHSPASGAAPIYTWDMLAFFSHEKTSDVIIF